jgi:branched-chain amino acid aminotransferase
MLTCEWTSAGGWLPPQIHPYQNLSLDPATCVFHYALECFEGLKAYKDKQGNVRLFRPDKNMERMNRSSARIALPTFQGEKVIDLIKKLCQIDQRFIPSEKGYSLYLRPTMIGTQRTLGIGPPGSAMLFVIASPVGPYYSTGFEAISLEATASSVRAWPGGAGDSKLGANYAPCIVPQMQAAQRGYQQSLWLFPDIDPSTGSKEDYVTVLSFTPISSRRTLTALQEVGTMNLFAAVATRSGQKQLLTAPLDGTILGGVTRDSILELARTYLAPKGWVIVERRFHMRELCEAYEEGRLLEVFGAGTAAIVTPVRNINYKGRLINCGLAEGQEVGPVAQLMKDTIESIQYGEIEHPWRYTILTRLAHM